VKLTIDNDNAQLLLEENGASSSIDLYSQEAFRLVSDQWVRLGWQMKYPYTFSWLGRPIIQLTEDMVRTQEVIYSLKPDVIVETGIAHGGSLIFYAGLCKLIGNGRVIGVDVEIRPHNREAIEAHELFDLITMIEGDSISPEIVGQVDALVDGARTILVILDSNHTKQHVLAELEAYHHLVTPGSYIVATDGVMNLVHDVPRGDPKWKEDNPSAAAHEFASKHPEFVIQQPTWPFNESPLDANVTHWPDAWLKRQAGE
jgi:cephalosporin hydroxylase